MIVFGMFQDGQLFKFLGDEDRAQMFAEDYPETIYFFAELSPVEV